MIHGSRKSLRLLRTGQLIPRLCSVANYDLYMTQAILVFIIINHKLMIKYVIECIVLN